MKDKKARLEIKILENQLNLKFNYYYSQYNELRKLYELLMTHLNLEFEDINPGIRVRKKK